MCAVCFGAAQLVPAAAMGARAVLAKRRLERAGTVTDAELEELIDTELADSAEPGATARSQDGGALQDAEGRPWMAEPRAGRAVERELSRS